MTKKPSLNDQHVIFMLETFGEKVVNEGKLYRDTGRNHALSVITYKKRILDVITERVKGEITHTCYNQDGSEFKKK